MKSKTLLFVLLILILLATACAPRSAATQAPAGSTAPTGALTTALSRPVDLNVFAAASLVAAFSEIGEKFEADHPEATVVFNFAGSQQLAQQINEGALADVFASANTSQMNVVIEAGNIVSGTQQVFVKNRLVVIYPDDNPAGVAALADLAKPGLKLVLAAVEVPVGQYSVDFLDKATTDPAFGAAFKDDVIANVVSYEDNVKAVLTKVALGEADAGIVYTSDIAGEDSEMVGRIDIPDTLNVIASYPIAPVADSANPALAQEFIDLVLTPTGQDILAKYNFIPASAPASSTSAPFGEFAIIHDFLHKSSRMPIYQASH